MMIRRNDMDNNLSYKNIEKRAKTRDRILRILTYIMLGVWAVMVLFPFYWMFLTSVKD